MRGMHTDEAGPPARRTPRSEPRSGSRRDGSPRDRAAVEIQVVIAGDSLISEIITLADAPHTVDKGAATVAATPPSTPGSDAEGDGLHPLALRGSDTYSTAGGSKQLDREAAPSLAG
jgi:hypothetical protein